MRAMEKRTGLLIKQIHDKLEKQANNALRQQGLTLMQVSVLMALQGAEGKRCSMKELERFFGVAQSTVAGVVSRLEQKNLVTATGDPEDKRVKLVCMTASGEACCGQAACHMDQAEETLLRGFTPEERAQLNSLLARVADNLN